LWHCSENFVTAKSRYRYLHLPGFQQRKALTTDGGLALRMSLMNSSVIESVAWLVNDRSKRQNVATNIWCVLKYII